MKTFILASLLVVAVNANLLEHGLKFQVFKTNFGKTYSNQVEETTRFNIFKDNLRSIEEHNALYDLGLVSYRQSVNKFSDMTTEEFRSFLKTSSARKPVLKTKPYVKTNVQIPESVDWRTEGYVTDIKDQGQCGSCWAFSITGSTEGAYYRKNQKLVSLSEQQLVDCSTNINDGCNGGYLDQTFTYVQEYGLETQESYPYTGDDDDCKYDAAKVVTKISDYVSIQEDESALEEAVATYGPVSVAMDASYLSLYDSGIYNDRFCSNYMLNHGVLVVGYGSENGKKYWIVKNSWGTSWGEDGYFRLLRGENTCGVAEDDTFPLIN